MNRSYRGPARAARAAWRLALTALAHLVDLVSDEAVPLTVNAVGRLGIRRFDEAEDLPRLFVDPVALVVDAVLVLHLQILHVRSRDIARRNATVDRMHVEIEGHRNLLGSLAGLIIS